MPLKLTVFGKLKPSIGKITVSSKAKRKKAKRKKKGKKRRR